MDGTRPRGVRYIVLVLKAGKVVGKVLGPMARTASPRLVSRRRDVESSRPDARARRRCWRRVSPRRPRRACPRARAREARAFARRTSPPRSREVRDDATMRPRCDATVPSDDVIIRLAAARDARCDRSRTRTMTGEIMRVESSAIDRARDVASRRIDRAIGVAWKPYRWMKPCGRRRRREGGGARTRD